MLFLLLHCITVSSTPAKIICVFCCQSLHPGKDEALFRDRHCQHWLHRYCSSVSIEAYKSILADGSGFFCYDCYQRNKDKQLSILEQTVPKLKAEISLLKSSQTGPVDSPQPMKTYTSATAANSESIHRESCTTTMLRVDHADRSTTLSCMV